MVTVGLNDQVTTEGDKGYAMSRGRAFRLRNSQYKGPEVGACLV